jgi:hypothetical protein
MGEALVRLDPARGVAALEAVVQLARQRGNGREMQISSSELAAAYLIVGRIDDFLALPLPPPQDRRYRAMQDLLVGTRQALKDDPRNARATIDAAVMDLTELGETEAHWGQEHALALAFVAMAEARAGMRTLDDGIAEARVQATRAESEPARQAIEREIARTRSGLPASDR